MFFALCYCLLCVVCCSLSLFVAGCLVCVGFRSVHVVPWLVFVVCLIAVAVFFVWCLSCVVVC